MKLSSDSETPLVSNTIIQDQQTSSVSNMNREDEIRESQHKLYSDLQNRIRSMVEFEKNQSDPKFKNALIGLKDNVSKFPEKNEKYMEKVETLKWDDNPESFLKWLKNKNKYPSPLPGNEGNDKYTNIDNQIYSLLEKIEKKVQSSDKSKVASTLPSMLDEITQIQGSVKTMADINRDKHNARLDYINYILDFYVNFCSSLKSYWEEQIKENTIKGGGSKRAVEDISEMYSRIFQKMKSSSPTKSVKSSSSSLLLQKKRMTQKNHY
jgi:hypothetical protein